MNKNNGFTIIEVMMVIVIIMIIAIAIPKFNSLNQRAAKTADHPKNEKVSILAGTGLVGNSGKILAGKKVSSKTAQQIQTEKNCEKAKLRYYNLGVKVYVFEIEGCEYVSMGDNGGITHKGNCKYCYGK